MRVKKTEEAVRDRIDGRFFDGSRERCSRGCIRRELGSAANGVGAANCVGALFFRKKHSIHGVRGDSRGGSEIVFYRKVFVVRMSEFDNATVCVLWVRCSSGERGVGWGRGVLKKRFNLAYGKGVCLFM